MKAAGGSEPEPPAGYIALGKPKADLTDPLHQFISSGISLDATGKNHDALDESPDTANTAGNKRDNDPDDTLLGISEIELMNSPAAEENTQQTSYHLLLHSFFTLSLCILYKPAAAVS